MKPFCKYLLILLIVLAGKISSAQITMQWQMGMSMQMQMSMMARMHSDGNLKYKFFVTMADSSRKEVTSTILIDKSTHKNYLLYVDKSLPKGDTNRNQRIYPNQTISIERSSPQIVDLRAPVNTPREKLYKGIAKDSCWMFKVLSGSINVYAYLSFETDRYFDEGTIVGIQLHDDGPIVKFTEENLKQMVGNDIDALENIQRKNYIKAINKYNRNRRREAEKVAGNK